MAGNIGSPLCAELNRIANYGVYPDRDDFLEEQGAANVWAGTSGLGLLGALNYIVDPTRTDNNYKGLTAVCNELAGTTGLSDVDALRTINHPAEVLLKGTTARSASYYVDAATPRYNYPGYIRLDGTQTMTTPDAAALDVTGDIDLRARVALTDWTPATANSLISKYVTTGNQRSYRLNVATDGTLQLTWSASGTAASGAVGSSVATGIADGATKWVRATLDVDNGASGNTTRFYLSDDGVNWTQLGSAIVNAGVTSIYAGTATLELGASESGSLLTGNYYQAQIFASLDGTDKRLDVDLTTNVTSATFNTFTATTGQLVTINGQDVLTNGGTAGSLLPTTAGSSLAADSNDPKFLDHTGTNYVYVPGVASNYLLVPNSSALQITGDIDFRAKVALDDWTPAGLHHLISKWNVDPALSYMFGVGTNGKLQLWWSPNGSAASGLFIESSVATGIADGATKWIRGTLDVNNGASGNTVTFYTSDDGTTWTQLGTPVVTAGVTSIYSNTVGVGIGATNAGTSPSTAKIYQAQIFSDITGTTKVLDVDTSVITSGADTYVVPTTYTGQAGAYFTGTGLSLNGVAGNYASAPDYAAIDVTGDLDIQVKVALADWTPAAETGIISRQNAPTNRAYRVSITTAGNIQFVWSPDGTSFSAPTSTVATGFADGATKWIRVAFDVNNGASGNTTTFYTSDDGTNWTQLGSPVVAAGVASIFNSTSQLEIGSWSAGAAGPANGTFYRAIVKNGIDGTTAFDANFETVSANALRMTESSTNRAVVTLNTTRYATIYRSTSGRKSVAVTQPTWLFGTDDYMEVNNRYMAHSTAAENYVYLSGAFTNYMSIPDNPPLDITGDLDIRVKVALDDWTPAATQTLIAKYNTTGNQRTYRLDVPSPGILTLVWSADGVNANTANSTVGTGLADGAVKWVRATLDVDNGAGGRDVKFFLSDDGINWTQLGSTVTSAGVTSIYSSNTPQEIGSYNAGGASPAKGKFYRAQVLNGIDGTVVLDADASVITLPSQTTFVDRSSNAYTVTINKSGVGTFVSTGNYLYLPGIASNNASVPDSAALDITGDIDVRVKVAMDDWTPSTQSGLLCKSDVAADAYLFYLLTSGVLEFFWIQADGTSRVANSAAPAITDGTTQWVRFTLDVDNGVGGYTATFLKSDDGINWTQINQIVGASGVTNIRATAAPISIGSQRTASNNSRGKFFRAQVYNGINGTLAFDANFEGSITSLNQATFTESSTNGATVTINRSGSTYRSAGVIDAGYLYPGATNTFSNSTTDFLNFGATDSFTILAVHRIWNTIANQRPIIGKSTDGGYTAGSMYGIFTNPNTQQTITQIASPGGTFGNTASVQSQVYVSGTELITTATFNNSNKTLTGYQNTVSQGSNQNNTLTTIGNIFPLRIGAYANITSFNPDMEFMGAAIFRNTLTLKNIADITNYFQGRD
jgi:hypothetical protein